MSDDKIHIFQPKKEAPVTNVALLGVTDAELLTEIERRGVNLPESVFKLVAITCAMRSARWKANGGGWTVLESAAELGGEAGEAIGEAKKLRRLELGMAGNRGNATRDDIAAALEYEIGDVIICAFNLANVAGVDAWKGVTLAFNQRSESMGFPERL